MKLFLSQIFSRFTQVKSLIKLRLLRSFPFKYKVFKFLKLNFFISLIDSFEKTPWLIL